MTSSTQHPTSNAETVTATSPSKRSSPKWRNITLWVLQVALALMFAMAGVSKLIGVADMVTLFENIGIGQWFRYLTGILELTAAVLLLIPALAAFGGLLLSAIMLGAISTHLFVLGDSFLIPAVYLVLSLLLVWGRSDNFSGQN